MVTPKARAKHKLLFNKLALEVGLLNIKVRLKEHNKVGPKLLLINFVTPKARAKHELLFYELASKAGLLNI